MYGETFALPEGIFPKVGARIMGLDDPTVKMSKSIATDQKHHAVGLLDSPDQVWSVLKRATTDSGKEIVFSDAPSKAGVNNLLTIYQALTDQTQIEIEKHFEGKLYGALKREVADVIIETLAPIQTRYNELMQDARALDAILQSSAEQAAARAAPTLRKAKEHMGFV